MSQLRLSRSTVRLPADDRAPLPQYSLGRILGVWAGAALPMAALAWLGVPWLASAFHGPAAWPQAILVALTAGLIWQFVFVLILVRREQGTDRKSTRLNSSHANISYAVFCLKKKKKNKT